MSAALSPVATPRRWRQLVAGLGSFFVMVAAMVIAGLVARHVMAVGLTRARGLVDEGLRLVVPLAAWVAAQAWLVTTRRLCLLLGRRPHLAAGPGGLSFAVPTRAARRWQFPFREGAHVDFSLPFQEGVLDWSQVESLRVLPRAQLELRLVTGVRVVLELDGFSEAAPTIQARLEAARATAAPAAAAPAQVPTLVGGALEAPPDPGWAGVVLGVAAGLGAAWCWFWTLGYGIAQLPGTGFVREIFRGAGGLDVLGYAVVTWVLAALALWHLHGAFGPGRRLEWDAGGLQVRGGEGSTLELLGAMSCLATEPVWRWVPWAEVTELGLLRDEGAPMLVALGPRRTLRLDLEGLPESPESVLAHLEEARAKASPPGVARRLRLPQGVAHQGKVAPGRFRGAELRRWHRARQLLAALAFLATGMTFLVGYLRVVGEIATVRRDPDALPWLVVALFLALGWWCVTRLLSETRGATGPRASLAWGPAGLEAELSKARTLALGWASIDEVLLEIERRPRARPVADLVLRLHGGGEERLDLTAFPASPELIWARLAAVHQALGAGDPEWTPEDPDEDLDAADLAAAQAALRPGVRLGGGAALALLAGFVVLVFVAPFSRTVLAWVRYRQAGMYPGNQFQASYICGGFQRNPDETVRALRGRRIQVLGMLRSITGEAVFLSAHGRRSKVPSPMLLYQMRPGEVATLQGLRPDSRVLLEGEVLEFRPGSNVAVLGDGVVLPAPSR